MTIKFYNIIRQLLCLVLFVPFMQVYGQKKVTDYLELDTILAYPDLTYHTEYVYTQYEDNIYIAKRCCKTSDSVELIITNIYTYQSERFIVEIPSLSDYLDPRYNMRIDQIAVFDNYMVLNAFKNFYLIEKKDGVWQYLKTVEISANARNGMFLVNDKIMVGGHIYHPHDTATSLFIYNLETEKIENFIEPGNYHTAFSYINGKEVRMIDAVSQMIAWVDRSRYRVRIFDVKSLSILDTFNRNVKEWKYFDEKKLNKQFSKHDIHDAMDLIEIAESVLKQAYQMRYVKFISSDKLLIAYQEPILKKNIPNVYIDIWNLKNGEWVLSDKNNILDELKMQISSQDSIYERHCYGICFLSNSQLFFNKNKLTVFYKGGSTCYPVGKKRQEYADCWNEYMVQYSPCLEVRFYKHDF